MAVDKLTLNFLDELKRRREGISPSAPSPPSSQQPSSPATVGGDIFASDKPFWGKEPEEAARGDGSLLNAVGAGLWSFADTALFGVPGAFVKEEEYIDWEDPLAKWTSAFGGFAGFVAGAPLKVGAKVLHKGFGALANTQLKSLGRQTIDDVVRGMRTEGIKAGVDKKVMKEVTKGYRDLSKAAAISPKLAGTSFKKAATEQLDGYVEHAIKNEIMTRAQGQAVRKMFTQNVFTRPIQDFKGLMRLKGLHITHPRLAKVIGHTLDDAIMFGAIDTIFEGVSMIEDGNFDWTAPLWGMGTGALFGQLGWLKPRGKAASFKKDFLAGMKKAFSRGDTYSGMEKISQLQATAGFLGEAIKKANPTEEIAKGISRSFTFKGKNATLSLNAKTLYDDIADVWGDNAAKEVMVAFLNETRRSVGKQIMIGASKEEAHNLLLNWRRMALGGIFFNAHTFYDMYAHGLEPEINDVLPNFLIGAWVQRRSNPAKFDLDGARMNMLRQNMVLLGTNPRTLSAMPTFDYAISRHDNMFHDPKYKKVEDLAEELGMISDNNSVIETPLAPDVVSAAKKPVKAFDIIYDFFKGRRIFVKNKDNISSEDAQRIADEILSIDSRFADETTSRRALEESYQNTQKKFEDSFVDLVNSINDDANILEIRTEAGDLFIPRKIKLDESLKRKAQKGELDFLVAEDGTKLSGDEALLELQNKVDGFNAALSSVDLLSRAKLLPKTKDRKNINSEELMRDIFQKVSRFEKRVESDFPDKSSGASRFTLADSFPDYIRILTRNHAIRLSSEASAIFSPEYDPVEKQKLRIALEDAGILYSPGITGDTFIVNDIRKLKIKGSPSETDELAARRWLGRVLSLQSVTGEFKEHKINVNDHPVIEYEGIKRLKEFLYGKEFKVDQIPNWVHSQIMNYAFMKRFEASDLSPRQQESLFALVEVGGGSFSAAAEGVTTGFTVKMIDVSRIQGMESEIIRQAETYNEEVRHLIKSSGGLVVESSERIVPDSHLISSLNNAVFMNFRESSATSSQIAEFLTMLSTTKKSYSKFQRQAKIFLDANPGNKHIFFQWLSVAGVFKPKVHTDEFGKQKTLGAQKEIELEKFTSKLQKSVSKKMDQFGYDAKYAEEKFRDYERIGRDNFMEDSLEREASKKKGMDLNTFLQTYRIDGKDLSNMTAEESNKAFKDLIFAEIEDRILHKNVLNRVLSRIHVKRDKEYISYDELSPSEKIKIDPQIKSDLIGLLGQQRAQVGLKVIRWVNGEIKINKETIQFSRLTNFLDNTLEIPYFLLDGTILGFTVGADGRNVILKQTNIFQDTKALPENIRKNIRSKRKEIGVILESLKEIDGMESLDGFKIIEIAPDVDPIIVAKKDLNNVRKPFNEFIQQYKNDKNIDGELRKKLLDFETKIKDDKHIDTIDKEWMFTWLMARDSFTGKDGDRFFQELMAGKNAEKTFGRIKLYHTKKYVRYNKEYIKDVADLLTVKPELGADYSLEDLVNLSPPLQTAARKVLRRFADKDHFGVAIWDDVSNANIKEYVDRYVKANKLDWDWNNVIGDAHRKATGVDSIAYVSRDMMMFLHTMMGHSPGSFNPIKPIISSGGPDSPLLMGKTVFVYDHGLQESFFSKQSNKRVDILLTKSAAKVFNPKGEKKDISLIDTPFEKMGEETVGDVQLRKIAINSLGVLPMKDSNFVSPKKSQADANYMTAEESKVMFDKDFSEILNANIDKMEEVLSNPHILRSYITSQLGDDAIVANRAAGEGGNTISDLMYYSSFSRDANPMSFSSRLVKNKMFAAFINSIMNDMRSSTNQFAQDASHHYGGSSVMVPGMQYGLKPTLVNRKGEIVSVGEIMLPANIKEFTLAEIDQEGYNVRFIDKSGNLVDPKDIVKKHEDAKTIDLETNKSMNLEGLFNNLNFLKKSGSVPDDLSIAIMVRRNPRTRPNDFALMSLKGFLDKTYGNSVAINPLDVVNIMEGDYDFDKADFFFSHRPSMFDHVKRASEFFVQGIDPSDFMEPIKFDMNTDPKSFLEKKSRMIANKNVYKSGIGRVQKIPRGLGYVDKLGVDYKDNPEVKAFNNDFSEARLTNPKILLGGNEGQNFMVLMDYSHKDFFMRSALETQGIIDMNGDMNPNISSDIISWSERFLFPKKKESFVPGLLSPEKVNAIRKDGNWRKQRVRIFRRMEFKNGKWSEVDLTELDKAVVKQMLSEYNQFLGVTGDSVYENTGEQRRVEYTDVIDKSQRFFGFNTGLNKSLYYRLRNRWGSNKGEIETNWSKDPDFKTGFGVKEKFYKDHKGDDIPYSVSKGNYVYNGLNANALEFTTGERGAPIDRVLRRFFYQDPFKMTTEKSIGGEMALQVDSWYNELLGGVEYASKEDIDGSISRFTSKADELTSGIKKGINQYNYKARLISQLKKKIWMIRNSDLRWDKKKRAVDNLNRYIQKVEGQIGTKLLPQRYLDSHKSRDLPPIEIVAADDTRNRLDGTIQYATLENLKNMLPFINGMDSWGLSESTGAREDLRFIRKIRRHYYSNKTSLKEFMKYGGKTLLTSAEVDIIAKFPEFNNFFQLENELLRQGYAKHGVGFLFAFMQPTQNKGAVGVFNGRPVSVPYQAQSSLSPNARYERGVRILTGIAHGTKPILDIDKTPMTEYQSEAREQLRALQFVEIQFNRFFNRRINDKHLFGDDLSNNFDVSRMDQAEKLVAYGNLRLPNFNKDFEESFSDFKSIQWRRDTNIFSSGFDTMNDHLIDWYRLVMRSAGKEKEFDNYLEKMHEMDAQMMGNDFIDPKDYMNLRASLDNDVKSIARDVFIENGPFDKNYQGTLNETQKAIMDNPITKLMGGRNYFKGVSLEQDAQYDINRLRQLKDMADSINEVKKNIQPDGMDFKTKLEELSNCALQQ